MAQDGGEISSDEEDDKETKPATGNVEEMEIEDMETETETETPTTVEVPVNRKWTKKRKYRVRNLRVPPRTLLIYPRERRLTNQ